MNAPEGSAPPSAPLPPALLTAVVQTAPVAMLLSAADGRIVLLNHEAEKLFGYRPGELLGRPVGLLVPELSQDMRAGLRAGDSVEGPAHRMGEGQELSALRKDGALVPVEVALSQVVDGDRLFLLSVVVDVTQRRLRERRFQEQLEQRVRERTAQLEHANRDKEFLLVNIRKQRAEFERLSREDPLTHLANRRDFDQCLEAEIQRAERQGTALSVAMLDLDLFKSVNDRFGHAIGDAVLREVAELIRNQCRTIDVVARYGGEEFALALPGSDICDGAAACERIRCALQSHDWAPLHAGLFLSTSAGVTGWRPGLSTRTLLAQADANLYEAKRQGRNRVFPVAPKHLVEAAQQANPLSSQGNAGAPR